MGEKEKEEGFLTDQATLNSRHITKDLNRSAI
jgi:hypothetical protein